MSISSSTLSLDGLVREWRVNDGCYESQRNQEQERSMDFVSKRRRRRISHKYQSLDNLTTRSLERMGGFGSLEGIRDVSSGFGHNPVVWRAYGKFVKGAWRRSRSDLVTHTKRAEELELRERSALIQMSSVKALLSKDKEIMRSQAAELSAMIRSVRGLENECASLKQQNIARKEEVETVHEEVNRLNDVLSNAKRSLASTFKNELAELERILAKKEKKRDKQSTEISVKTLKIEDLKKETTANEQSIKKMQDDIKKLEMKKYQLKGKVQDAEMHCKKVEGLLEQRKDEKFLLEKDLSEMREANQMADTEVTSLQTKLLDQDMTAAKLEKVLKMQYEELENLRVGLLRNPGSKWDKFICGVWAASCVLHLIKALDRRWP